MNQRAHAAVWGAIAGHTLGAPLRGRTSYTKLSFYDPVPQRMAACPPVEAWLVLAKTLAEAKRPADVPSLLEEHWAYREGATAFASANLARGLQAPLSGCFENPLSEDSSSLGRAIFWGIAFPGQPELAASWASFDATYDHAGEAVMAARSIAAAVAVSGRGVSVVDIVRSATSVVPSNSLIHRVVALVLKTLGQTDAVRKIQLQGAESLAVADPNHAVLTWAYALAAFGNAKDPIGALLAAAGCGASSDVAAMVCGTLACLVFGDLPSDWTDPLGLDFVAGHGLRSFDPPLTIDDVVTAVGSVVVEPPLGEVVTMAPTVESAPETKTTVDTEQESATEATDGVSAEPEETEEAQPVPAEESTAPISPKPRLPEPPLGLAMAWQDGDLQTVAEYIDSPVGQAGSPFRMAVRFWNGGQDPVTVRSTIASGAGWPLATRLDTHLVPAGEGIVQGVVAQPDHLECDQQLVLTVDATTYRIPVLAPMTWWSAGPFSNEDGAAFTKEFPAERSQKSSDRFSGRSGMPLRWAPVTGSGRSLDVEPLFQSGPGVVVFYARLHFPVPGRYKVVAAGSPGVVLRVNGETIVKYLDTHKPVPGDRAPYSGSFDVNGDCEVLIRVMRDRTPAAKLVLYFLSDTGAVVDPVTLSGLPE